MNEYSITPSNICLVILPIFNTTILALSKAKCGDSIIRSSWRASTSTSINISSPLTILVTIQTNCLIKKKKITVFNKLKPKWAKKIVIATGSPHKNLTSTQAINFVYGTKTIINAKLPITLNNTWAAAVLLAATLPPIEANIAVTVVPILLPNRIATAPISGTAPVEYNPCNIPIVALLDWTIAVETAPTISPSTGISPTATKAFANSGNLTKSFNAPPITSNP